MADARGVEEGRETTGSQTGDAANAGLAGGAAGSDTGPGVGSAGDAHGDLEERRETEQVLRPTSDGMGEGLTKDRS